MLQIQTYVLKSNPDEDRTLSVKYLIHDRNMAYAFIFFNINKSKVEEVVDKQIFSATDFDAVDRLITSGIASFHGAVEAHHQNEKHRDLFNNIEKDANTSSRRPSHS